VPAVIPWPKLHYLYGSQSELRWHAGAWLAAVVAEVAVIPLRRGYPVPVLAVTIAMAAAHLVLLPQGIAPADLAVALAAYAVATSLPRMASAGLLGGALLGAAFLESLLTGDGALAKTTALWPPDLWLPKPTKMVIPALVLAAAWFAGDGARSRRVYLAATEQRATDAERDRDQRAALAAASERERISRELHDVIAHALSVVVIQAQGASSALRRDEAATARDALDAIVSTGRDALAQTRRVLGVIRGPGDPELVPQPSLADLPRLADAVRDAGTPVLLQMAGRPRPLPDDVELSAYRIIQEALTNTMRHAGPGVPAEVSVCYADAGLVIKISDHGAPERSDGSSGSQPGSGRGLAGMRARVSTLDGELSAGPAPGGGFLVHATLPVKGAA